jgi:hypothetical protein
VETFMLKIGDTVIIKKGTKHGMSTFKEDTPGIVDGVHEDDKGGHFYGVLWRDKKGRERHTYTTED